MSQTPLFLPFHLTFPNHQYFLTRDWVTLSNWFQFLNPTSRTRSTTFAVTTAGSVFAASLQPFGHLTNILHGEVYGLVAASLLSQDLSHPHIFSDHLNSVNFLSTSPSTLSLKNNPARSLYRWLLHIWSSSRKPLLSHVRAHTDHTDIASTLNRIVDHFASASQHFSPPPSCVPVPTFFMDSFLLFSPSVGFVVGERKEPN